MQLTATSTAAKFSALISATDLLIINAQVPESQKTVLIQNTQASATLYIALNYVTATSSAGIILATGDSVCLSVRDLASLSLLSSAASNTVAFEVNS